MAVVQVPVLEDMNGYFLITMYASTSDGGFKRTAKRPFRTLTGLIQGVSSQVGTIEVNPRIRSGIRWRTPTVVCDMKRPQSVYHFFRTEMANNQYYIATSGYSVFRATKLNLHKIVFKTNVSSGVKRLYRNKCIDAMQIWGMSKKGFGRKSSTQRL